MTRGRPIGKVLSIVGTGRTGTTILANILGQIDGVCSAGELRWLWGRDLVEQRLCSCGRPPARCPVWSRVVEQSLGMPPGQQGTASMATALQDLVHAQDRMASRRNRLRLLRSPSAGGSRVPGMERVMAATTDLLSAVFQVTGAHTIVDISKRPEDAAVVAATRNFDHYVVHLVRDPRAVVHSWNRTKEVRTADGVARLSPRRPVRTISQWVENAVGAEVLRRHVPAERWLFYRYEDFVTRPRASVAQILAFLEEDAQAPFLDDHTVQLGLGHVLSGNPNRFESGAVSIAPDAEWSERLRRRDQVLIQAATLPFLVRYGYLSRDGKSF